MNIVQNYHYSHTKIDFGMILVVILYDIHTSFFAVYSLRYGRCTHRHDYKPNLFI